MRFMTRMTGWSFLLRMMKGTARSTVIWAISTNGGFCTSIRRKKLPRARTRFLTGRIVSAMRWDILAASSAESAAIVRNGFMSGMTRHAPAARFTINRLVCHMATDIMWRTAICLMSEIISFRRTARFCLQRMLQRGALVTVATDGPCSNNDLDMFEELRTAAFLQKSATGDPLALPAYEALRLATVNGARAMGRADGELGVLRAGALADVVVVDLQKPHLQPIHDVMSNLVYCGKAADVETVVIDGRIVVENRRIEGLDLPQLYHDAAAAVERIKKG